MSNITRYWLSCNEWMNEHEWYLILILFYTYNVSSMRGRIYPKGRRFVMSQHIPKKIFVELIITKLHLSKFHKIFTLHFMHCKMFWKLRCKLADHHFEIGIKSYEIIKQLYQKYCKYYFAFCNHACKLSESLQFTFNRVVFNLVYKLGNYLPKISL